MKITEIICEDGNTVNGVRPEIDHDHGTCGNATLIFRDKGGIDRFYHLNRIMLACAEADGLNTDKIDRLTDSSWMEKNNIARPYSKEEYNMLLQAFNTIPTDFQIVSPWQESTEMTDTGKQSPVLAREPVTLKPRKKN